MTQFAIIMAGGVGSRFWPLSRTERPKQFLDILGLGKSLLQMTYDRFTKVVPAENILIVANESYRDMIKAQLPEVNDDQILGEPMAKNTAPCIAYASYKIRSKYPDASCVVAPSDHLIMDEEAFIAQIKTGLDFVEKNDALLTLGIKPSRPDTGYGYIQFVEETLDGGVHKVKTFTEKPDLELANQFLESGDFLWNAGIFLWSVKSITSAFNEHLHEIADLFQSDTKAYFNKKEVPFINKIYPVCSNISIDYGIIEKASNVFVLPSDFGWSDLGTWKSLHEVFDKNDRDNAIIGNHTLVNDTSSSVVVNDSDKLIVVEGVDNLIIVNTNDALLICRMDKEQHVKRIVGEVKKNYRDKYL